MTFFNELQQATQPEREALLSLPFIQAGANGDLPLQSYIAFLGQTYHHVKHTTPLLMACGSRLPASKEWLRDAIAEYVEEELGHQEWILNDIRACGADPEKVRHEQAGMAADVMVAYAYDIINRRNPVGFFGMVQVLEGTSVRVATQAADALRENLALPKNAFSYLYSHGSLDIEHIDYFESLMNKIEDPQDRQDIIHCAKVMYQLYGNVFRGLPLNGGSSHATH